jgi:sugar transferase (PEP-CTERM/EpsH1 system associated)
MKELLFLAHRIPYPPTKGDKIRSFNMLKQLAGDYRVHLGTFIDDADDWHHVSAVQALCGETCFIGLRPLSARLRSLAALARGEPLTLRYYRSRRLQSWVDAMLARGTITRVFVFSSSMAQYVERATDPRLRRVLDFVDMDSDKWRQYAPSRPWPLSWIYAREATTLLRYERRCAARFDASVFVSEAEARLFRSQAPESAARVSCVENGVDTDYFSRARQYPNPYGAEERAVVFTGAMDYWANVDAVSWFATQVYPRVRAALPQACFYIVGARPTGAVRQLAAREGVHVTGTVADIRPYLAHAAVAVAPLRIARGVQNKVLEAMAMGHAVLMSQPAAEGLRLDAALRTLICADADAMIARAVQLLTEGDREKLGERGCEWVARHYSWSANLSRVGRLFEDETTPVSAAISMSRA